MTSSVWFKFKSQKDPTRVTFDGTGIAVFTLKKEIIDISKLGDGTDFDLHIYNQDTNEEYDDDTFIIPRSTSVIARRLPAAKPGAGKAARYVKGAMPVTARPAHPSNAPTSVVAKRPASLNTSTAAGDSAQTEQDRIQAMLDMGGAQWEQEKQQMSTASRVPFHGFKQQKSVHAPDDVPPLSYTCHRCQQKGHWIQNCPTNNDPNFDGRPKLKRVTGIPKSMLKSVDDVPTSKEDGLTDEARQPTSVMVNADGDRVVAIPDNASWEQYKEKAQASAAQKDKAELGNKELQERGLECRIDKRMFVNPMKTPCCGTTYCYECIDNALADRDLVCPHCETEGVIIEDLERDEEMIAKIKVYEDEKKAEKAEKIKQEKADAEKAKAEKANAEKNNNATNNRELSASSAPADANGVSRTSTPGSAAGSKKRVAEEDLTNDHKPDGPVDMQKSNSNASHTSNAGDTNVTAANTPKIEAPSASDLDFVKQMDQWAGSQTNSTAAAMGTSTAAPMFPMNMNMMPPMAAMPNMPFNPFATGLSAPAMPPMPPMNMGQMPNMPGFPQWNMGNANGMYNGANMYPGGNMYNNNNANNMWPNWTPQQPYGQYNQNTGGGPMQNNRPYGQQYPVQTQSHAYGNNAELQQLGGGPSGNDSDAYMRKPVNPHRHGKQKKNRPQDFRQLG